MNTITACTPRTVQKFSKDQITLSNCALNTTASFNLEDRYTGPSTSHVTEVTGADLRRTMKANSRDNAKGREMSDSILTPLLKLLGGRGKSAWLGF